MRIRETVNWNHCTVCIAKQIILNYISFSNEAKLLHNTSCYIYFNFSTCFGQLCAHNQENLLYLSDTGSFHTVCVAVWSTGWDEAGEINILGSSVHLVGSI